MKKDIKNDIIRQIADLKEEQAISSVEQAFSDGAKPLELIDWCHKGMIQVGERYEKGEYAIAGLIMAGEIMRQVGELVFPYIESNNNDGQSGRIVLGTIEGDIHYIGKDIFKVLVRGHGFTVHDLGVDVPPAKFLSAIMEIKPDIVGFSCLLTHTFKMVRETINFLEENVPAQLEPRAYILGGRVDNHIAKETGITYWTDDAMKGVQLCKTIMLKK